MSSAPPLATPATRPYALFDIVLKRRIDLSPSLARLVFGGADIMRMRTLAPDQRVKLFFPDIHGVPSRLPTDGDWHDARRHLPPHLQPPMRTYTIRNLRAAQGELDIEFVLHGETGPASTWATHAKPGDRLQIAAPTADHPSDPGGYEWQPPPGVRNVLLIGDETALPAIAGILEGYAGQAQAPHIEAFIEVPRQTDCIALASPPTAQLHWLARDLLEQAHGEPMLQAARTLASLPSQQRREQALPEVDIDAQILWELASPTDSDFYAWIAGESAAVMAIRKYLVNERGIDRQVLTLMGYWRQGRALN